MTKREIDAKAKTLDIKGASKMKKEDLIRAIQRAEGHNECFLRICDCRVDNCLWRADCQ